MAPDPPIPSPECMAARDLFPQALEDPASEKEVLAHAGGCLECMDAFLELKDTVKRLHQAASALPETGTFAARVFASIAQESRKKAKRRQLLFAGGGGVLVGLILTVPLILLAGGFFSGPRALPEPPREDELSWPMGSREEDTDPTAREGGKSDLKKPGPPVEDPKSTIPREVKKDPGPQKKPDSSAVDGLIDAYHLLLEDRPFPTEDGRKRRFRNTRRWMEKVQGLPGDELDALISRIEEEPKADHPRKWKVRQEVLKRLKHLRDKGFLRFDPSFPPKKKK